MVYSCKQFPFCGRCGLCLQSGYVDKSCWQITAILLQEKLVFNINMHSSDLAHMITLTFNEYQTHGDPCVCICFFH